jgi:hypothetical protein
MNAAKTKQISFKKVFVYYTDEHEIMHDIYTNDSGSTWSNGKLSDKAIRLRPDTEISALIDPVSKEIKLIFLGADSILCELRAVGESDALQWRIDPIS